MSRFSIPGRLGLHAIERQAWREEGTRWTVAASVSPSTSAWVFRAKGSTVELSCFSRFTVIRPSASRIQKFAVASSYVNPCRQRPL